jgi:hypothetical protein
MKNLDKMFKSVLKHYEDEDLTSKQMSEMYHNLERICKMFYDGYDRARALEIEYNWGGIDANLVQILHQEV